MIKSITRLTTEPMSVPNIMIQAIDFIIMQNRIYTHSGMSYRRINEVVEVVGMESDTIQLNKIFRWNPKNDAVERVGVTSQTLNNLAEVSGKPINELYEEIENRKLVLQHMINQDIRSVSDVNRVIELYYKNPQKVLNRILL